MIEITIASEPIDTPDAAQLLAELSSVLESITGNNGASSFDSGEMEHPRACFAMARSIDGAALGCGAIRPLDEYTAEMKRVFARDHHSGVGRQILCYLEEKAIMLGFERIVLETRMINQKAVSFYLRNGYTIIPNYGKYAGRDEAVCFEKKLTPVSDMS